MKRNKLLFSLIGVYLLLGFSSCSNDDKSVFGDDFDIPKLTDANTIQFTVDATGERKMLQIIGGGGRMAVDWGDGRLQKIENTDANPVVHYKYGNSKKKLTLNIKDTTAPQLIQTKEIDIIENDEIKVVPIGKGNFELEFFINELKKYTIDIDILLENSTVEIAKECINSIKKYI